MSTPKVEIITNPKIGSFDKNILEQLHKKACLREVFLQLFAFTPGPFLSRHKLVCSKKVLQDCSLISEKFASLVFNLETTFSS